MSRAITDVVIFKNYKSRFIRLFFFIWLLSSLCKTIASSGCKKIIFYLIILYHPWSHPGDTVKKELESFFLLLCSSFYFNIYNIHKTCQCFFLLRILRK